MPTIPHLQDVQPAIQRQLAVKQRNLEPKRLQKQSHAKGFAYAVDKDEHPLPAGMACAMRGCHVLP